MRLLPILLSGLCFAQSALALYNNEGFRIDVEPELDPITGLDIFQLSWVARESALYTLEASLDLRPPWFAVLHVPEIPEPDLEENELVEIGYSTDADRLFFRVVEDHGIRLEASCEPGEGVRLDLDGSRWASRLIDYESDVTISMAFIERASNPDGPFTEIYRTDYLPNERMAFIDRSGSESETSYYRAYFNYNSDGSYNLTSPISNIAAAACPPAVGPVLVANGHSDRIVLNWVRPPWALPGRFRETKS